MYSFHGVSERVERMRDRLRATVPHIDITRYRIVTEFYMAHPELTGALKRAMNFKNLCEKLPCTIHEDEVLIGTYVGRIRASALYPENSIDFLITELQSGIISKRESDPYLIEDEDRDYILSTADFWMGECMNSKLNPYIPEKFAEICAGGPLFFTPTNICPQPVGHFVPNHDRAIRVGFGKIKAEAEEHCRRLEEEGFMGDGAEKYIFYRSVAIVCEGMILFAKRYAAACREKGEGIEDPARREELLRQAEILEHVVEHPARNFREALQALWFYQMCVLMDANLHGTSVGRIDRYLGDFAERDIAEGRISREEAQELIDMYFIKVAEMNKVWSERTSLSTPGYTSGQLITVGGVDSEGNDATNIVSFMCLESAGRLRLQSPTMGLRVHGKTPAELWNCGLAVSKKAGGILAFFADEPIREALEKRGIAPDDSWNYCPVGCVEPSIGGAEWPACGGIGISSYINIVNVLLLAINDGKNYRVGPDGKVRDTQFGPRTGYLYEMESIEDVKKAYLTQLEYWVKWHVNMINLFEAVACNILPQPVVSAAMDGCMEKGRDVMKGGARYNSTGHSSIGLGNMVDSFAVIDRLCFREKKCTTRELYDALVNNWQGYGELREYIMTELPRYGNGDEEADEYCRFVAGSYADCVNSMTGPRGRYAAGMYPVTMNVVYGGLTAASPDGRYSGDPLSDGISAVQGMDKNGPTAILRSVASFDYSDYSNGTLLNMKFHPSALSGEEGYSKLRSLMSAYFFGMGGMEMQLNIVDSATLRDAQKHPENYRDLVVRIAGFSAYFVDVYKKAQDDLIRRTELEL